MNTKTIEKRINRNLDRTKRDLAALKDDTVTGLSMKIGQTGRWTHQIDHRSHENPE